METIIALGAWNWMILAAVLFVLELLSPSIASCGRAPSRA
jgi:membrane protein implicated in regulation of membrane protease activity